MMDRGGHAARERRPVIAVRRDDVVIGTEHRDRAGAHRLLADVQVAEAADLAQRIRLGSAFLEPALQEHRAEQLEVQRGVALLRRGGRIGLPLLFGPGGGHEKLR